MPPVQTTFSERMPEALAGMIADMQTYTADSRSVENSNGVPFGYAVGRGTNDRGCRLGAAAATDFLGIAVRDVTLAARAADSDYVDEYMQYDEAAVLTRGDIWVSVAAAVADGDNVTYNALTGRLSSIAADASNFLITGARFITTQATTGGLAIVRLSGYGHAA